MVTERLSSLIDASLPPGITSRMGPVSSIMGEIMQIAIPIQAAASAASAPSNSAAPTQAMAVREYADWVLRPRLMAIPDVAQVIPIGGELRQFQVQPDTARMAQLGVTLEASSAVACQAEQLLAQVPEVSHMGRRGGRAELDEHAEGVHVSDLDVGLLPQAQITRSMDEIKADMRARMSLLPVAVSLGQPISHRIDHILLGVRSQIAIKIFGEDLDPLRGQAESLRARLAQIPGLADLEVEKMVLAPQLLATLQTLVQGEQMAQIIGVLRARALSCQ